MTTELIAALERARQWDATATPEEKAAMFQAQRESWMRAEAPCEHGNEWDECAQCYQALRTGK